MPGAAVFPTLTTTNSSTVSVNGGKQDAVRTTVASKVSEPNFVDNAIYHAIYDNNADVTGRKYTVTKPLQSDFQVTHGRRYSFVEEEDAMLLTHYPASGVKTTSPAFFNTGSMTTGKTPPVLLFAGSSKIRPDSITTATQGSRINLRNMKGQTLSQLGMDEVTSLNAGQIVNVGLRTTDIVLRLFKDKQHGLNSVTLGRPFSSANTSGTTTYKGNANVKHSTTFLSTNMYHRTIPQAARMLGRSDNYAIYHDIFGNFIYAPNNFSQTNTIVRSMLADSVQRSKVDDVPNRIVVQGVKVALNDDNNITLDDTEKQKEAGIVKSQTVVDPTATSKQATQRAAKQMLRMSRKANMSISAKGLPNIGSLQPGDVITFNDTELGDTRQAVVEVNHYLTTNESDIQMVSYETGLERVLISSDNASESSQESEITFDDGIVKSNKFNMGLANWKVQGQINRRTVAVNMSRLHSGVDGITFPTTTIDRHSGFLIGHRGYDTGNSAGRSALGTGLTPRTAMSGIVGTTITVTSTTGFPSSGNLLVRKTATVAAHVAYTGKTSTTFTGVTLQAPSGGSIPTGSCDIILLRPKSHEIGVVKGITHRGDL